MHTLEPELQALLDRGELDAERAARLLALERGVLFPVFEELRIALYVSVAALASGLGLLLKENRERIGPAAIVIALALLAAVGYGTALRARLSGRERSLGGDYLLLLGALVLSADLGYAESQFHWLGPAWPYHLLLLALLHGVTAYYFDSRLLLSLALGAFTGWFGIEAGAFRDLDPTGGLSHSAIRGLECAALILMWREAHRRLGFVQAFLGVFAHFAANIAFWAALAWCFQSPERYLGLLLLGVFAALSLRHGLARAEEAFVVYAIGYVALGLCVIEVEVLHPDIVAASVVLATVLGAAALLWRVHARLAVRSA